MSLRELFPTYPLTLRSPPKSKVKFGTRNLYVDLPWQSYNFLQHIMNKALGVQLTTKEVREEWHKFLLDHRDFLMFHGKPFISVSRRFDKSSGKSFFALNVKWDSFIKYLEEKSMGFLPEIEKNGQTIMDVYREIWTNFFSVTGIIIPSEPQYFPSSRERFRKLLKRTGDYFFIENLLGQFEGMIKQIEEKMKNKIPSVQLYTTNFVMGIQHLRTLIDVVDVPAAYLLLRNLLENFVKFLIYLDIGRSIDPNIILYSMFLYEYEVSDKFDKGKGRRYSLERFKTEFIRKFLKMVSALPSDKPLDLSDFVNKLEEKKVPTLGISPRVLQDFSESYGLDDIHLDTLYSACSNIIHNQPPLPFFSLLEVKFFKHFLEKYLQSLFTVARKLIDETIKLKKVDTKLIPREKDSLKKCIQVAHLLKVKYDKEIKNLIAEALTNLQKNKVKGLDWIWIKPITLCSIFDMLSPSFSRIRDLSFIKEDLEDIIEKLQPLSFKVSLRDEVNETLDRLQEILIPNLEEFEVFSSLESVEEKNKVIFYLLLLCLSEIVEEIIKS